MRRSLAILAGVVLTALGGAYADELPASAVGHKRPLIGELRVRYLLRQIDLTEEQAKKAEQMIEQAYATANERAAAKVRSLWKALAEARAAGDEAKAQHAIEELKKLDQHPDADKKLLKELEAELTECQKRKLKAAEDRLSRHPNGGVNPGDMYRIVREFDLSPQQNKELMEIYRGTRELLGPILRPSEKKKIEMVNYMYGRLLKMLTPEQREVFVYRVRMLRPDLIDEGLRVLPVPEAYKKFCQRRHEQEKGQGAKAQP